MLLSELKTRYPEFNNDPYSGLLQSHVDYWVTESSTIFNLAMWGNSYHRGLFSWVAHNIANQFKYSEDRYLLDPADGLSLQVPLVGSSQEKKIKDLVTLQAADPYMGTVYGQEFKRLAKRIAIGGMVV